MARKYIKKEKEVEVTPVKKSDFDKQLLFLTKIKPPKKEKLPPMDK